jgi:hypothetical protein
MIVKNQQQNQTTSIIAINNDAVYFLKIGELNESYSLLSKAIALLYKI